MISISVVQNSQDIQRRAQFDEYAPTPTQVAILPTSKPPTTAPITTGCNPGTSTCTNGIMNVCTNSAGTYSSFNCANGCEGNSCRVVAPTTTIVGAGNSSSCTPGMTSCNSGIQYTCTNSNGTSSSFKCSNGCNGNTCAPIVPTATVKFLTGGPTGSCIPGTSTCTNGIQYTCTNSSGSYSSYSCSNGCKGSTCAPVLLPTAKVTATKVPQPTSTSVQMRSVLPTKPFRTSAPTRVPENEVLVGPSAGTCFCKKNGSNVACSNQSLCCGNSNFANVDSVKDREICGPNPDVVRTEGVVQTNTQYENYGCGPSTLANILIDNGVTTLPNGKPVTLDNVIELYYPNFTTVTGIDQNLQAAKSIQPKSFILYDSTTTESPTLNNQEVQKLMKEQLEHGDKLFVGSVVNGVPHWYEVTEIDENGNMIGVDSFFDPDGTKNHSDQASVVNYTYLNVQTSQSQIIVVPQI